MAERLFDDFPPVSTGEWREAIEKDLRGGSFDEKLLWRSEDGIVVKPFYRQEDLEHLSVPFLAEGEAVAERDVTFTVEAYIWREAGATVVQELAFAIASAVDHLAESEDAGKAAAGVRFKLGVGSDFFFEAAMFRALRLLWSQAGEAFGVSLSGRTSVHARCLMYTQTACDPYLNLVRSTTEAMSALIGGADEVEVLPYDAAFRTPGELSKRLARNAILILDLESYFRRVSDPLAGSYFMETLTDQLARSAWTLFQRIEAAGGWSAASSLVERQISEARTAREAAVAASRKIIVGVNQFQDAGEDMPEVERLIPGRLASPVEEARFKT